MGACLAWCARSNYQEDVHLFVDVLPVVKHTVAPFATRDGCVHHVPNAVRVSEHRLLAAMVFGGEMDTCAVQ